MSYYVILPYTNEDAVLIDSHPRELPFKSFRFGKQISLAKDFPNGITYSYSQGKLNGKTLKSTVDNAMQLLIISSELKSVLSNTNSEIEFLPITIADHKLNVVSTTYSIAHCIEYIDCVDIEKSIFETSPFNPKTFFSWEKIVFNEDLIGEKQLFKVPQLKKCVFVSEELKNEIKSNSDISGIRFCKLEEYDDITF